MSIKSSGGDYMRITVTAKGDFEKYILEQMEATGMAAGTVVAMLAIQGMEQRRAVNSLEAFTKAVKFEQQKRQLETE